MREPKDAATTGRGTTGRGESWQPPVGPPALCLTLVPLVVALLVLRFVADLRSASDAVLTIATVAVWAAVLLDSAARPSLTRPDLTRPDPTRAARTPPDPAQPSLPRAHPFEVLVLVVPFLQPLRGLPRARLARTATRTLTTVVGTVTVPIAARLVASVTAHPVGRPMARAAVTDLLGSRRALGRRLALVGVTATASWLVDRLQEIQRREERTEATVQGLVEELRSVQARLDVIEQRRLPAASRGDAGRDAGAAMEPSGQR